MPAGTGGTVAQYLASLPPERRAVIAKVRATIRKHLPKGYKEAVSGRCLAYVVPLSRYPETYNGHPLWYVGLAAQKNYYTLHLMGAYGDPKSRAALVAGFKAAGKRLDMGQACVRFKDLEALPLDVIGQSVASIPLDRYVARVDQVMSARKKKR